MRIAALLLSMLIAGTAQAGPANPADVEQIMRGLGVGADSAALNAVVASSVAEMKALPGSPVQSEEQISCIHRVMLNVGIDNVRDGVVSALGDQGDTVVADWLAFMASPMGEAIVVRGRGDADASDAMVKAMTAEQKEEAGRFLVSPSATRLMEALAAETDNAAGSARAHQRLAADCDLHLPVDKSS